MGGVLKPLGYPKCIVTKCNQPTILRGTLKFWETIEGTTPHRTRQTDPVNCNEFTARTSSWAAVVPGPNLDFSPRKTLHTFLRPPLILSFLAWLGGVRCNRCHLAQQKFGKTFELVPSWKTHHRYHRYCSMARLFRPAAGRTLSDQPRHRLRWCLTLPRLGWCSTTRPCTSSAKTTGCWAVLLGVNCWNDLLVN